MGIRDRFDRLGQSWNSLLSGVSTGSPRRNLPSVAMLSPCETHDPLSLTINISDRLIELAPLKRNHPGC